MKKPVNSSFASVNQNSFGSRSGFTFLANTYVLPTHIGPDLDPNCLILKAFLIVFCYFSEKGHFEENQKATLLKSYTNLPSM